MVTRNDLHGVKGWDIWTCRIIWCASFALSLPIAIAARLTGWRWKPWASGPGGYKSPIREADSIANTIVGLSMSGC